MSTTEEKPPPRKFPPPCWSQGEALALIEAYRERWYALRRGYLRTADWEAVAAEVARRCPDASPAKTSAQCRHKMEKLRQRYRAEKQRALSFPGRFFSSWLYFDNMDSMENGSDHTVKSNQEADDQGNPGNGLGMKTLIDPSLMTLKLNSKNFRKTNEDSNADLGSDNRSVDQNLVPLGYKVRNFSKSGGKRSPKFGSKVWNGYSSYLDIESDKDAEDGVGFGAGFHVSNPINGNLVPFGYKSKKYGKTSGNWKPKFGSDYEGVSLVDGDGFRVPIDHDPFSGLRAKKFGGVDGKLNDITGCDDGDCNRIDGDDEFWMKMPNDKNSAPPGFKPKWSGNSDVNLNSYVDSRVLNGHSSSMRSGTGKKRGDGGTKRGRDPVEEMVSSIKLLGEGIMNMEKMKMEMIREIEQMRMETELRRNELLLESQQQIVEVFVRGLSENKKKMKTIVSQDP